MTKRPIFGKINISMFPNQPNQDSGQPPAPSPQPYNPPQPPQYNAAPTPQQSPNGQYQVVPPLPAGQNNGHTGHNPYEFIVNPNKPKRSFSPLGGDNVTKQIAILLGGVVLLLIIIALAASLLKPKSNTASLVALAERQQEIVRVATEGADQAVSQSTKNFAINTEAAIGSSQSQLVTYLAAHGTKISDKELALDESTDTDTLLTNAAAANTYDTTLVQTLTDQINTYEGLLQTAFQQTSNPNTKQLLQQSFGTAKLLLEQSKTVHS